PGPAGGTRVYADAGQWAGARRRAPAGGVGGRGACRRYGARRLALGKIPGRGGPPGYRPPARRRGRTAAPRGSAAPAGAAPAAGGARRPRAPRGPRRGGSPAARTPPGGPEGGGCPVPPAPPGALRRGPGGAGAPGRGARAFARAPRPLGAFPPPQLTGAAGYA